MELRKIPPAANNPTLRNPKYPEYRSFPVRLSTLAQWPIRYIKEYDLAFAGFFYQGVQDIVVCYVCGLHLRSWDPGDVPLEEHMTWSPSCPLLAGMKVPQNVIKRLGDMPQTDIPKTPTAPFIGEIEIGEADENTPLILNGEKVSDEEIKTQEKLLNECALRVKTRKVETETVVLALREFGYSDENIEAARERLKLDGENFNVSQMMQALMEMEATETLNKKTDEAIVRTNGRILEPDALLVSKKDTETINLIGNETDLECSPIIESPEVLREIERRKELTKAVEELEKLRKERECIICMSEEKKIIFLPCGHLVACRACAKKLDYCPTCRIQIKATVVAFF